MLGIRKTIPVSFRAAGVFDFRVATSIEKHTNVYFRVATGI